MKSLPSSEFNGVVVGSEEQSLPSRSGSLPSQWNSEKEKIGLTNSVNSVSSVSSNSDTESDEDSPNSNKPVLMPSPQNSHHYLKLTSDDDIDGLNLSGVSESISSGQYGAKNDFTEDLTD